MIVNNFQNITEINMTVVTGRLLLDIMFSPCSS